MSNPIVSIVIPTKNRYDTLFPLVRAIEKICEKHSDIEVIVQDNSDDNSKALVFFSELQSKNIRYYYEGGWLSVGDNSDLAILHSTGEFVSFIGDDDAFTEHILDVAKIMKDKEIDACGCDYALYRWPAAMIKKKKSLAYYSNGSIVRCPLIFKELKRIMHNGIQTRRNLPGVYHGLIKREKLFEIYMKTGTFFPGPSPDMANSFALSLIVKKYIMTSVPFIIDGYSKASTGHLTEVKKHIGTLDEQSFLPRDTVEKWSDKIPKIWLPNTIWPESALQALNRMNRKDLEKLFNNTAMYIKIENMYPQCKSLCEEYIDRYSGKINLIKTYIEVGITYMVNRIKKMIERIISKYKKEFEKEINIEEAIQVVSSFIEDKHLLEELRNVKFR